MPEDVCGKLSLKHIARPRFVFPLLRCAIKSCFVSEPGSRLMTGFPSFRDDQYCG
jgi:hypothetical protein